MTGRLLFIATFLSALASAYRSPRRIPTLHNVDFSGHPDARNTQFNSLVPRCEEKWRAATLDHFSWGLLGGFAEFPQRYYVCDEFWKNTTDEKGPIFLYTGNEAAVEKYIDSTGLMWELAPEFGAMLVFIEHRYYGKSKPFGSASMHHLDYLSAEQAMADYVEFLFDFQNQLGGFNLPVIGFGGSYGGMLCSWMRMKYPHAMHGAIASSAPIWSFMGAIPPVDPNYYDQIKTYTAAMASENCVSNIRRTWVTLFDVAMDPSPDAGFEGLRQALRICPDVDLEYFTDLYGLMFWIDHAISIMAEGSYGFPSDYLTDGVAKMPPYPLRLGCSYLSEDLHGVELLEGVGKMVEVYYNVTKDLECFTLERELSEAGKEISDLWSHQYCTEMFQLFGSDGVHDMFWDDPWDPAQTTEYCRAHHGVEARPYWATQQWGGKDISTASNIIFTNGEYDPWRGGGVQYNVSDTVFGIIISEGGHHSDLMLSTEADNESLNATRQFEKEQIEKWILEVRDKNKKLLEMLKVTHEEETAIAPASEPGVTSDRLSNTEDALDTQDSKDGMEDLTFKDLQILLGLQPMWDSETNTERHPFSQPGVVFVA